MLTRVLVLLTSGLLVGVMEVPPASARTAEVTMTAPDVQSRWDQSAVFGVGGLPDDATGTVTFTLDGDQVCVAEVSGPQAFCKTDLRPEPAAYAVTATYSGDPTYDGAGDALSWQVTRIPRMVHLRVRSQVRAGHRALLRVRLPQRPPCGPFGACRARPDEGVIRWTVVRANGGVRLRHHTAVEDGRATWRTPRLPRRGRYLVIAQYDGGRHFTDADNRAQFRVTQG